MNPTARTQPGAVSTRMCLMLVENGTESEPFDRSSPCLYDNNYSLLLYYHVLGTAVSVHENNLT